MGFSKLREWVGTVTGKGDRWEGDDRVGLSPPPEWPEPPHSLHLPALHGERPANFIGGCCFAARPAICWLLCLEACARQIICRLCPPAAALFSRLCACSPLPCHAHCPSHRLPPFNFACFAPCSFHVRQDRRSCKSVLLAAACSGGPCAGSRF